MCSPISLVELQAAAIKAMANAVVITDHSGIVIWVNSAFEQLTGYMYTEIVGQSTQELKSGLNPQALYEEMWRTILGGRIWRGELTNRRKDGSLYDEEMTITPVRNSTGEITHFVAIKLDIAERKTAQERLQLWSRVLDQSAEGIFVCDPRERILLVNATFERVTGFSADEAVGKTPRLLSSGRQDRAFYPSMWKSLSETGTWHGE